MSCLLKFGILAKIITLDQMLDVVVVYIRNVPHRPRHLNTWFPIGSAV